MEEFCDLERARQLNDMRLEHAFENIFARYSKDFTEVGDEIDLTTGEVVVNNGHLSGMRGEQDVGDRPGRTLLRSLAIESTGTQPSMAPDEEDELFMEQNALCVVPQTYSHGKDIKPQTPGKPTFPHNEIVPKVSDFCSEGSTSDAPQPPLAPISGSESDIAALKALGQSLFAQMSVFMARYQCLTSSSPRRESSTQADDTVKPLAQNRLLDAPVLMTPSPTPQQSPWSSSFPTRSSTGRGLRPDSESFNSPLMVVDPSETKSSSNQLNDKPELGCHSIPRTPRHSRGSSDQRGRASEALEETPSNPNYSANTKRRLKISHAASSTSAGFSENDDEVILKLKNFHRQRWDDIAQHFPGKQRSAVQKRYHQLQKRSLSSPIDSRTRVTMQPKVSPLISIRPLAHIREGRDIHFVKPQSLGEKSSPDARSIKDKDKARGYSRETVATPDGAGATLLASKQESRNHAGSSKRTTPALVTSSQKQNSSCRPTKKRRILENGDSEDELASFMGMGEG